MPIWNHVTNKAWNEGRVVYAMDQALTPGFQKCPQGYCVGLAVTWASLRWKLSDYAYNETSRELNNPDPLAVETQRVFDKQDAAGKNHWVALESALGSVGLKMDYGKSQMTDVSISGSGLYSVMEHGNPDAGTKGGNGVYVVGMRGDSGSHAIGIANEGDTWWRLFDGNYGHFRMQKNSVFKNFVIWYLGSGATNYLNRYNKGWTSVFAKPKWL